MMKRQGPKPTGVLDVLLPVSGMDRRHLFGTLKELRCLNMWPQARLTGKDEEEPLNEVHCVRLILALLGAEKIVDIEKAVTALETLPAIRVAGERKGKLRMTVATGDPLGLLFTRELCGIRRGEKQHITAIAVWPGPKWMTIMEAGPVLFIYGREREPHLMFERTRRIDGQVLKILAEFLGPVED